jgi:DNA-binding NarL/FixJ family response regulator
VLASRVIAQKPLKNRSFSCGGFMALPSDKSILLIVDAKKLRRACLVSHFRNWAESRTLDVVPLDPSQLLDKLREALQNCRMVILSLGASCVADTATLIKSVRLASRASIVVLSDNEVPGEIVAAVEAGAAGFFSMDLDPGLTQSALGFILDGGSYFPSPAIRPLYLERSQANDDGNEIASIDPPDDEVRCFQANTANCLTPRQQEVLKLLKMGESNKIIGRHLGMTEATVKVHVRHIMRKFGASNRIQVAICAICPDTASCPDASAPDPVSLPALDVHTPARRVT